MAIVNIQPVAV